MGRDLQDKRESYPEVRVSCSKERNKLSCDLSIVWRGLCIAKDSRGRMEQRFGRLLADEDMPGPPFPLVRPHAPPLLMT